MEWQMVAILVLLTLAIAVVVFDRPERTPVAAEADTAPRLAEPDLPSTEAITQNREELAHFMRSFVAPEDNAVEQERAPANDAPPVLAKTLPAFTAPVAANFIKVHRIGFGLA